MYGRRFPGIAIPLVLFLLGTGCNDDADPKGPDTGAGDTGGRDTADPGPDTGDTGGAEVPLDGFGEISGDCGVIEAEDLGDEPGSGAEALFRNHIDFGETAFDYHALSDGGKEVYDDGNLGGSSLYSEVFAYEVLYRCELAALLKTEGEILYEDDSGKKTDLLVEIDQRQVGVSVTRAYGYPPEAEYTVAQATDLLTDKLEDIQLSNENVSEEDAWNTPILHVIAYAEEHAESVETAYGSLEADLVEGTLVMVTVTDGDDDWLY